jgi:maltose O-acetyltransferase
MISAIEALQKLARVPGMVRAQLALRGARVGPRVHLAGSLQLHREGEVRIGDRSFFLGRVVPIALWCQPGAELIVGESVGFNYGASVRASRSVRIGNRCMVGSMVLIRDDDGFTVAPVSIGDGVWMAHGAIIEPGVTVGDNAVISAGSVVVSDVPAGTMAVGNPARIIPLQLTARSRDAASLDAPLADDAG